MGQCPLLERKPEQWLLGQRGGFPTVAFGGDFDNGARHAALTEATMQP